MGRGERGEGRKEAADMAAFDFHGAAMENRGVASTRFPGDQDHNNDKIAMSEEVFVYSFSSGLGLAAGAAGFQASG